MNSYVLFPCSFPKFTLKSLDIRCLICTKERFAVSSARQESSIQMSTTSILSTQLNHKNDFNRGENRHGKR